MKMTDLELAKILFHNYLIATLSYSTLSLDMENIKQVVKISKPYDVLINGLLNVLEAEIKDLREEMNGLKINSKLEILKEDEYFIEYLMVASGETHNLLYARASLRNHVAERIETLFNK